MFSVAAAHDDEWDIATDGEWDIAAGAVKCLYCIGCPANICRAEAISGGASKAASSEQ